MNQYLVISNSHITPFLKNILREEGDITIATTFNQGRELIQSEWNIIILEAQLQENTLNYQSMIKECKENAPSTPILIISQTKDPALCISVMRLGASSFLPFPFTKDQLLSELCRIENEVKIQINTPKPLHFQTKKPTVEQLKNPPIVLIVDDEIYVRESIQDILLDAGFDTLEAGSGKETLDVIQNTPNIDLVILDIGLPDTSGIELLPPIKSAHPNAEILILTAYNNDLELIKNAFRGNAYDYLAKPYKKQHLLEKLYKALRKQYEDLNY